MSCWQNNFSHIYVEKSARDHGLTEKILARFPKATQIEIDHYKDVFARPGQDFPLQKKSMKLILAVENGKLLYPGSENAQDFGYPNFYYNTLILNCLYNCAYCYLQGMYPSANLVVFVNLKDFFQAVRHAIENRPEPATPLYLPISYDTDLLAFESIVPFCREWIEFSRNEADLLIEIRTKSANFGSLKGIQPHSRAVLAWTLSPEIVAKKYENGTPPTHRRLTAAKRALDAGWPVRLCFDPVLRFPGWQDAYKKLIEETFATLPAEKVRDVSLGVFRMNADYFKKIKKMRTDTDILHQPYQKIGKIVTCRERDRRELTETLRGMLENYLKPDKIEVWT